MVQHLHYLPVTVLLHFIISLPIPLQQVHTLINFSDFTQL